MNKHRYSFEYKAFGLFIRSRVSGYSRGLFYMIFIMTGLKRVGNRIRMEHERSRKGFNIRLANIETDDYN